jgi:hypothetical protein
MTFYCWPSPRRNANSTRRRKRKRPSHRVRPVLALVAGLVLIAIVVDYFVNDSEE